jgi:23S rRNA (guanosine2251-2'-O)-methyltransferase
MDKEQTLIFGIRSVKEAIDSNKSLNRVYIQRGLKGVSAFDLIKTLHKKNIEISYVPIEKLNRFTIKNHQGVRSYNSANKIFRLRRIK